MTYEEIRYELEGPVLTLTLNRPARLNAWTTRMQVELCDALDRADADDAVRAVVVTGAGRGFCSGADLSAGAASFDWSDPDRAQALTGSGGRGEVPRDPGGRFALRCIDSTKPLIAAINGPAVGIGVTMTLPMDVRLASTEARIGFVFTRRGLVPEAASTWFLPRVVGISTALEWIETGRIFDPDEALSAGLLRSVHEPDELLAAANEIALEIAENTAPVSVALSRRLLWTMLTEPHPMAAHRADSRGLTARGASADAREGVEAFLEKRRPAFPDRVSDGLPELTPWRRPPPFS
jgi:enoyl-CoA hydratase/carnithine racemase